MNRIRAKLRSQKGASITFALLIFLVCAVVSSVVVVAGSAAAGRMSQITAMDQRYYAVTSAAELLCSIFDGKTVQVTAERNPAEGTDGISADAGADPILAQASRQLVKLLSTAPDPLTGTDSVGMDIAMTDVRDGLACAIQGSVGRNGLLVFHVTSGSGAASAAYTVRVVFASDVRKVAADSTATATATKVTWKLDSIRRGGAAE